MRKHTQTHFIPLLGILMIGNFVNSTNKIEIIYIIYICNFIFILFIIYLFLLILYYHSKHFFPPSFSTIIVDQSFSSLFLSNHWRNYLIKNSKVTSTRPTLAIRVRIQKPIKLYPTLLPSKFESLISLLSEKSSLGPVYKISYLPFEAQS